MTTLGCGPERDLCANAHNTDSDALVEYRHHQALIESKLELWRGYGYGDRELDDPKSALGSVDNRSGAGEMDGECEEPEHGSFCMGAASAGTALNTIAGIAREFAAIPYTVRAARDAV